MEKRKCETGALERVEGGAVTGALLNPLDPEFVSSVRLAHEVVVPRPPTRDEARLLLAGLPGTQWRQSLSSKTQCTPHHLVYPSLERPGLLGSSSPWLHGNIERSL
jgi:hypothetical protein